MKKMFRFAAVLLMAGAMFTACGGDDGGDDNSGGGNNTEKGNYPEDIKIANATSGEVKAGFSGEILITGENFDQNTDWIYMGYEENGQTEFVRVDDKFLSMSKSRISFGVHVADDIVSKTIKVYLERPSYDKMPLTGEITFKLPSVSEGYIPDPGFRATLMSTHPQNGNSEIASKFDMYGIIDPATAATIKKCGVADYGLNLIGSPAKSLEGIELFKSIEGTVPCWGMGEIEVMDVSKWVGSSTGNVALFANNGNDLTPLPKLKKFIGGPILYRVDLYRNSKLEYVDLSLCKWCYNVQLFYDDNPNGTVYSNVTYLDLRKDRSGKEMGGPSESDSSWKGYPHAADEYVPYLSGAWFKPADNCHILIDYQFLIDKWTDENSGYTCILSAWQRGATVDVYSSKNITKKLGTVPMYSDNPTALTPAGQQNGWVPSETE